MGAVLLERHRNQVSRPQIKPYTELQVQKAQLSYSCSRPGYLLGFQLCVWGLLAQESVQCAQVSTSVQCRPRAPFHLHPSCSMKQVRDQGDKAAEFRDVSRKLRAVTSSQRDFQAS